jgi:RNA polymerase sigma factor (sigma-70 family)
MSVWGRFGDVIVMNRFPRRSEGVTGMVATPEQGATQTSWERFEQLYRSSRDDVFAYVATLLGDRSTAEDVTELAFERAYRRRRTFDRRRGEERAWLFGIARNAALDELRRRKRHATLVVDPEDPAADGPDDGAEVALARTVVRARDHRAEVPRRPVQRRTCTGAWCQRVERRHAAAPDDGEAQEGL